MADTNTMGYSAYGLIRDGSSDDMADDVRRAELKDADVIAQMARVIEGDSWYWTFGKVVEDLGAFIVEGDPVHGFARAQLTPDGLLITQIAVKPEMQRKGVATRILKGLEAIAREAGLSCVYNMGPKTKEINAVYQKLGYRDVGEGPYGRILVKEVNDVQDTKEAPQE